MVSQRRGPDGLTDFERDVCNAVDSGLSDRAAYRSVRPDSTAADGTAAHYVWRVRQRPHCAAYLKTLKAKSLADHLERKDRIIEELAVIAFSDIGDLLTTGPDGLTVQPMDKLTPAQRRAMSRVSISRTAHGGTVRVAMHDKLAALDKLCRLFGFYDQACDADAEDPSKIVAAMSDVERAQRLAAILQRVEKDDGEADHPAPVSASAGSAAAPQC